MMNENKDFISRYNDFLDNNLPTPFWDEERKTYEYVHFDDRKELNVNNSLVNALGDIAHVSFYYPFYFKKDIKSATAKYDEGLSHAHSFEDVVTILYNYPESFYISEDIENYYSEQELEYLRRVQKYLLFIGLNDFDDNENRYNNEQQSKYENVHVYKYSDDVINKIIEGKINFRVMKLYPEFIDIKYEPQEYRALIVNESDDFKVLVEFTSKEVKTYQEIKNVYSNESFNDLDKVIVSYFKIIEIY